MADAWEDKLFDLLPDPDIEGNSMYRSVYDVVVLSVENALTDPDGDVQLFVLDDLNDLEEWVDMVRDACWRAEYAVRDEQADD